MSGPAVSPHSADLLGQLAVTKGLVTPEQLRATLEIHGRDGSRVRLGDLLVAQGLITTSQLQALLAEQEAIQARNREVLAMGGPGDAAAMEAALRAVTVGRTPVAAKATGLVEAELEVVRERKVEARNALERKAARKAVDRGIELDLGDAPAEPFEIESGGSTREIRQVPRPARPEPQPPPASPEETPLAGRPVSRPAVTPAPAAPTGSRRKVLGELVIAATRAGASDLHLHPGYGLMIRQHGKVVTGSGPPLAGPTLRSALLEVLSPAERESLAAHGQVECIFEVPGIARCRMQLLEGVEGVAAALRLIPLAVPALSALGLPNALARFLTYSQGLVLLAGPAGCGKSWTLATLVEILNTERKEHLLCIERPIEFLHPSRRCLVTQRQVPGHAESVARAVRAALHEDPDVLVIGEIDDAETVKLAAGAAEAGKLVLATFCAAGAVRAVARMIGLFPSEQQGQLSAMLADGLRAVVGQRLVPMTDGRRMPICEVVEVTPLVAERIQAGRAMEIAPTATFDQALSAAVRSGLVSREEAKRQAERPEQLP